MEKNNVFKIQWDKLACNKLLSKQQWKSVKFFIGGASEYVSAIL